jgi:hypothetical protein
LSVPAEPFHSGAFPFKSSPAIPNQPRAPARCHHAPDEACLTTLSEVPPRKWASIALTRPLRLSGKTRSAPLMTGLEPTENSDQLAFDSSPPRRRPKPLGVSLNSFQQRQV